MSSSRRIRRLGAIVLLFSWAQVATANAVPCAIWCHLNDGAPVGTAASVHAGHGGGQGGTHHTGNSGISGSHCGSPDLLVVAAVAPGVLAIPATTVTAVDPPVAAPPAFIASFSDSDTPPPRS